MLPRLEPSSELKARSTGCDWRCERVRKCRLKPARHGNKFRTDGRGEKKRMHESSACFCFAFDRKRHLKPGVTGEQHRAPCWFAIRRRWLCQEGKINKMKRLSKNGVWDFQAEGDADWRCPSRAWTHRVWFVLPGKSLPQNPNWC